MRNGTTWLVIGSAAVAAVCLGTVRLMATPPAGFTGTTVAVGRLDGFEVENRANTAGGEGSWESQQHVEGQSDLYVQSNAWAPGGSTGWHSHPGHSLIVVTAGTVTVYEGDDPTCTPHVYTQGMAFVDEGGSHVHLIRNEGGVEARTVATQLIPAGAPRRIDAPAPAPCSVR
jgi:quercetin dioxygenase-like cupin family protein